jgi:filamentous hemagglutinin family protein
MVKSFRSFALRRCSRWRTRWLQRWSSLAQLIDYSWLPIAVGLWAIAPPAQAESIIPDQTLPMPSIVMPAASDVVTITGGTLAQKNLFHSFDRFSVLPGQTARFITDPTIQNVITRVTGALPSQIDGLIQATSPVNLFLLNPNGISFGADAQLQLGGSFFASTAPGLRFADGSVLTTDPTAPPLLTVSVPLGVQWGTRPAAPIQNQATLVSAGDLHLFGGNLTGAGSLAAAGQLKIVADQIQGQNISALAGATLQAAGDITLRDYQGGALQLLAGGTIALSGNILIDLLNQPDRDVILHSQRGDLSLDRATLITRSATDNPGQIWLMAPYIRLDKSTIATEITSPLALVTSGQSGRIGITTDQLTLRNGSVIASNIATNTPAKGSDINIVANAVNLTGGSYIQTGTAGTGAAGNIAAISNTLTLSDRAQILSLTNGSGNPGNIGVMSRDAVILTGPDSGLFTFIPAYAGNTQTRGGIIHVTSDRVTLSDRAQINTSTFSSSPGGDVVINAQNFEINGRAQIRAATFGPGAGGDLAITASRELNVIGAGFFDPQSMLAIRAITTSDGITFEPGGPGKSGTIVIETAEGILRLQGEDIFRLTQLYTGLDTSSFGLGRSGNLTLNAPTINFTNFPYASVSSWATGNAGNFTANADTLTIADTTLFAISILGKGATLNFNANQVVLDNGVLLVGTLAGQEGNINFMVTDRLLLRNDTQITARAYTASPGGNITFQGGFIIAHPQENNDLVANAVAGPGGNIRISAKAILGLQFRPVRTPLSDINASSTFGIDGNVSINAPQVVPNQTPKELSTLLIDPAQQITQTCSSQTRPSSFVVTGRGGIPLTPREQVNAVPGWRDRRGPEHPVGTRAAGHQPTPRDGAAPNGQGLVAATDWRMNSDGNIQLIASAAATTPGHPVFVCATATGSTATGSTATGSTGSTGSRATGSP